MVDPELYVTCRKCNGQGRIENGTLCIKCVGDGKVVWTENIFKSISEKNILEFKKYLVRKVKEENEFQKPWFIRSM